MKKLISVLAALVVACMTCVTAMAAISSPEKVVIPERGTVTTTDGEVIEINDAETFSRYIEIKNTDVSAENVEGYSPLTVFEVKFKGITSADVILHVPGVKAGDTIIVRMFVNGQWVDVEAEVIGDNQIRLKLTQAGVIEILKATSSNGGNGTGNNTDNTNGSSTSGSNTSSKSPKTGETNALPAAYAVFTVCVLAAGVAGIKLRKKAQ